MTLTPWQPRRDSEGFLYLAARLYYSIHPPSRLLSEALTCEKAQRFANKIGERFTLRFYATPFPLNRSSPDHLSLLTTTRGVLTAADWSPEPRHPIEASDGNLDLWFDVESGESIIRLHDRRDPDWDLHTAFERRIVNWGTQNWGGVTIAIHFGRQQLYRCDIDVFSIEDSDLLTNSIRFFAISFDPKQYGNASTGSVGTVNEERPSASALRPSDVKAQETGATEAGSWIPEHSVKCPRCGANIDVGLAALTQHLTPDHESIMLTSCTGCRRRYQLRVLASHDQLRTGIKYEVQESDYREGTLEDIEPKAADTE